MCFQWFAVASLTSFDGTEFLKDLVLIRTNGCAVGYFAEVLGGQVEIMVLVHILYFAAMAYLVEVVSVRDPNLDGEDRVVQVPQALVSRRKKDTITTYVLEIAPTLGMWS